MSKGSYGNAGTRLIVPSFSPEMHKTIFYKTTKNYKKLVYKQEGHNGPSPSLELKEVTLPPMHDQL